VKKIKEKILKEKRILKPFIFLVLTIFCVLSVNCVTAATADTTNTPADDASITTTSFGTVGGEGIDDTDYLIPTRITGLHDYTINQNDKVKIKVDIEGYYEHWGGVAYRYVDFYLYDPNGVQVWKDKSISSGIFNPGHVSITINNQNLNLSPGIYFLMAKFEARSDYGPSQATAHLTIKPTSNPFNKPQSGDTRITGLVNQTVIQGDYSDIIVKLESFRNSKWNALTLKNLYFSLYDANGKLTWKDKFRTDYNNGIAVATIYTSALNLPVGIYRVVVEYVEHQKDGIYPSKTSAYLTVTPNISNDLFDLYKNTYIQDLNDYTVTKGKKITVKAKLVSEHFNWATFSYFYEGEYWRWLNFDLYNLSGTLLKHTSELTNYFTCYASTTIDTKKLNLAPGTYLLRVTYDGNQWNMLKPCGDYSFLYVT
jgi:hypothetical protein